MLILAGAPILHSIWLGFTDTSLLDPTGGSFTGLANYASIIQDGDLVRSLTVTLVYTAITVVGSVSLGSVAALLVHNARHGRTLFRVILTLPWAIPTVAAALIFNWMFNESSGILNRTLQGIGLPAAGWLTDPDLGLFSVTLASVWLVFPFVMLVVLSALQSIPDEMYEAARIDGAGPSQITSNVVLPLLAPTIRVVALLATIWSFRRFDIIWLLTQGGPLDTTNTLVVDIYRRAFSFDDLGLAASVGVVGLALSVTVTMVFLLVERRNEQDGVR